MKIILSKKILSRYFIIFKSIFKIFASIIILLLTIVTVFITYKTQADVWEFFKLGRMSDNPTIKYAMESVSILIGIATAVQSAPIIWDKLIYWGQYLDNVLIKLMTGERFFLYEVDESLKEMRKLINQMNAEIQKCLLPLAEQPDMKTRNKIHARITELIDSDITFSMTIYKKIVKLLRENNAYDNITKRRKEEADDRLNTLISEITIVLSNIAFIKKNYI